MGVGAKTWSMADFLKEKGGCAVIDGGLATELERQGADLNDPLWSAKCLIGSPHLIRQADDQGYGFGFYDCRLLFKLAFFPPNILFQGYFFSLADIVDLPLLSLSAIQVHLDYLEAGSDIIITASYQATIQGFESKGLSREESENLLQRSVDVACEARNIFLERCEEGSCSGLEDGNFSKQHPLLVAASIGSYGAYLADGSEYSGNYGDAITLATLKDFHRRRVQVLADSGADLIAFETIPNKIEAQAYVELLEENGVNIPAWFSFNSKDGVNVVSGDSLLECASIADSCKKVVAVGINCTSPRFIHGLILSIKKVTTKPIVIYPNSGETYDGDRKEWVETTGFSDEDFVSYVNKWREAGASLIGGCCRTTPNTIRAISRSLCKDSTIPASLP